MTNDNEEAAKAAAAAQPPPNPEAAKHSVTGAIFHGLLDVLGGKTDTSYQRDPQTGKMVATETPKTPGQQWATLASSILAGAAAGAQTNKPGAQGLAGFAAGGEAAMKQAGQRDQQKRAQATEDLDQQQKTDLQHAQMAKMNQDLTDKSWQASQMKIDAKYHEADRENEFNQRIKDAGPGARDLGVHRDADDLMETHKSDPSVMQAHLNGTLQSIPHVDENGKYDGVHYAVVPQEYLKQKTAADRTFRQMVPGKNPGDAPTIEKHTIPAGSMSNADADLAEHAAADKTLSYQIGQQTEKQKSRDAMNLAAMKESHADARAEVARAEKGSDKAIVAHDKAYVQPANAVEKSYQMMDSAYKEYEAARKQGKELPTGAQSMLALSTHLSTTFGNVKGARISKDMIEHHLGARGVGDKAQVAIQKLTNGDVLSPDQWDAFHGLIKESRKLSWDTATKEAERKKIPIDFLPPDLKNQGPAKPFDPSKFPIAK
jgi:hypothetical protein